MDTFSAISDPTRRQIIEMLALKGKLSATDISGKFKISAPAISQHLKVLREAKLINVEKKAQQRIYKINPRKVAELQKWTKKLLENWEERFARLDILLMGEKAKKYEK